MANPEHLEMLKKGVGAWNQWRVEHLRQEPDLCGADLGEANLSGANLRIADLREANLCRANLVRADLRGADLVRVNLSSADLYEASLDRATLNAANLRGAKLLLATLIATTLNDADFSDAHVGLTTFGHVDLSVANGVEKIAHDGPSTIGIDTIYESGGNIPDAFLRGAGVPDIFISYARSLVGKPIEFYSCFISYSSKDQDFAERLYADLQATGVRCWFAPHHMAGGKKVYEQIDQAIRLHERLLIILSPASMASEWVQTEIAKARTREVREHRRVLFPVRLVDFEALRDWACFDADTGKDSAREIREYFIPNFSRWKDHDSYREALERLLRDLRAEAQKR